MADANEDPIVRVRKIVWEAEERWQDEFIASCEEQNRGPLSDWQYAGCLRKYARDCEAMNNALSAINFALLSGTGRKPLAY